MFRILAISGNRPQKLNKLMKYGDYDNSNFMDYLELIYFYVSEHLKNGYNYFIIGGAIGVDLDIAEAVLYFKNHFKAYKDIKLEIAIPCVNQSYKWSEKDKKRYDFILENADYINYISEKCDLGCYQKRNQYMVDKADKLLAIFNGEENGGTWNTIKYARKKDKNIEIVDLSK